MAHLFDLPDNTDLLIEDSARIMREAIETYQPTHIVSMVSGGGDSALAHCVAEELGIKVDLIMHGVTGTGIPETTEFVIDHYGKMGPDLALADAGDAYERYVMRKGFFGVGQGAHAFAYHILKADPFRATVSREIRKRKRGVRVMLINGARKYESDNRRLNMKPVKIDKGNVWVNIVHNWRDQDKDDYLASRKVVRNPVSIQLCRSGECMCGTQQTHQEYAEAKALYPRWAERMDALRACVKAKHGFDWGDPFPKPVDPNQIEMFGEFQPMCSGCNRRAESEAA